jgi:hypothetical protein
MINNINYISNISDNNIFHIFYHIIKYYSEDYINVFILSSNINIENKCQQWRLFVMKKIYKNVQFISSNNVNNRMINVPYDHMNFIKYQKSDLLIKIIKNLIPPNLGKYILLNQRKLNNRYVYDYETKEGLDKILRTTQFKIPIKTCCFDEMSIQEQYNICSGAKVFISMHGAACTNLIFTPQDVIFIEINFRTNWYCDPVCDDHFNCKIGINDKCNGKLLYPNYHKADYHNLAYLLGRTYFEINPISYGGKFIDRNPISKENIYVNTKEIINIINTSI